MRKKKIMMGCAYILICLIVYAIIFLAVAWSVLGYYATEKVFTKQGCTIALTNDFIEGENENYTAYYHSTDLAVTTKKALFEVFSTEWNAENKSAEEYAELMQVEYAKIYPTSKLYQDNDLLYFVFEYAVNGKRTDKYLVSIYKSEDAFWQVSFGCHERKYKDLEQSIFKYAQSVCVGE